MNEYSAVNRFAAEFARMKPLLPGVYVPWLQKVREEAFAEFADKGFPTVRHEDWKYTSVARIETSPLLAAPAPNRELCSDLGCVGTQALPGAHLMVFVDGHCVPELGRIGRLPAGVEISSVATTLAREAERLHPALSAPAGGYASGFDALNTALLTDGAYVRLADGADLDEPLHLLFVATMPGTAVHIRNVIDAGSRSHARIVEHHCSVEDAIYLSNVSTSLHLARGAAVEHHKLQEESTLAFHIAAVRADLREEARLTSTSFAFGGALSRVGIDVGLNAEKASCALDGLTLADGRQHADHHTRIDHTRPQCLSREFYKGVLDGASRAVFNGKVIVHAGAQKTDAQQTNRNLLLSDLAEVDSKPQLEIWADDVKCGHGAAIGRLDPDQIFYLRARGIDEETARSMLIYAFAGEVVERVDLPALRERLERLLRIHLPHGKGVMQ